MQITYFDSKGISQAKIDTATKSLENYRAEVNQIIETGECVAPESALVAWKDETIEQALYATAAAFKKPKHVVLIGIGGSSLGTEAIHSVLATVDSPRLHILDTVSAFELESVLRDLQSVKKVEQLAVCIVSKSGTTTETLANAAVLLGALEELFGKDIYRQIIYVGGEGSELVSQYKKLGAHTLTFPEVVSGRYSVFTPVGLMPLLLLGHDIEAVLQGAEDALSSNFETAAAESAARLYTYLKSGVRQVNCFMFDTRLVRLGKWYRQLAAESLGKEKRTDGKKNSLAFIPTISTPVELHSVGQLYFSGFLGVYTDFVIFDDDEFDFELSAHTIVGSSLAGKSMQEIQTAIFGGVIGAYQADELPYRATQLDDEIAYSLGLFMNMRMLETMYLAHLMKVDAFNQPNVEGYKELTRNILRQK